VAKLTRDEIFNIPAGFQIDGLVSDFIMKDEPGIRYWSSNIDDAWKVVEKFPLDIWMEVGRMSSGRWYCELVHGAPEPSGVTPLVRVVAETAPLAICRAALLAVTK
jgi:hypothetical protein